MFKSIKIFPLKKNNFSFKNIKNNLALKKETFKNKINNCKNNLTNSIIKKKYSFLSLSKKLGIPKPLAVWGVLVNIIIALLKAIAILLIKLLNAVLIYVIKIAIVVLLILIVAPIIAAILPLPIPILIKLVLIQIVLVYLWYILIWKLKIELDEPNLD